MLEESLETWVVSAFPVGVDSRVFLDTGLQLMISLEHTIPPVGCLASLWSFALRCSSHPLLAFHFQVISGLSPLPTGFHPIRLENGEALK